MVVPVKFNFYPWLSAVAGGRRAVDVKGETIGECLDCVHDMFPGIKERLMNQEGSVRQYISILLNGVNTYPEELLMPVKNGDEISIICLIDGG